jgi:hypothetical protein
MQVSVRGEVKMRVIHADSVGHVEGYGEAVQKRWGFGRLDDVVMEEAKEKGTFTSHKDGIVRPQAPGTSLGGQDCGGRITVVIGRPWKDEG